MGALTRVVPALLCLGIIFLPGQTARTVYSAEKEHAMAERYAAEVRRLAKPVGDSDVQAYVDRVGQQLVAGLPATPLKYRFEVILGTNLAEPSGLPGGYVFIPARILANTRDEHEFAGTLAHAIAHSALRHGLRTADRGAVPNLASIPLIYMGGWTGAHADPQGASLVPMAFLDQQMANELEADQLAVQLAARAGYNPSAFLGYIERTHPPDSRYSPLPRRDERLQRLRETVAVTRRSERPPSDEFQRVQKRVASLLEQRKEIRPPTLRR